MRPDEFHNSLEELIGEAPTPFFALAVLVPGNGSSPSQLWAAVRSQLRLDDGDLVAILPDGRLAVVINQVDSQLANRVLSRIRRAAPVLADSESPTLFTSPLQEQELLEWAADIK